MSGERSDGQLDWPPRKEDLQRLYVDERLSSAKIAQRYGLKYASPKTAESTVLYHLKRAGIVRRDPADHVRKVTEDMVDGWVRRYLAGESLKQIAGDRVNAVSVFDHLKKRGLVLRDKVDAQTEAVMKFRRVPFNGDRVEEGYIMGFVWGDCSVEKHGRAIRVRSGTTHSEFVDLFENLFAKYGHIRKYPKRTGLTSAELNLEVDLDGTFEFLLQKLTHGVPDIVGDRVKTWAFVAGLFDAEGTVLFHRKAYPDFRAELTNTDQRLLEWTQSVFLERGYHPCLSHHLQRAGRLGFAAESEIWKLSLYRHSEVRRLLLELPLRHGEKMTKARLAVRFMDSLSALNSNGTPEGWKEYLNSVREGRDKFIAAILAMLASDNRLTSSRVD